MGLGLMLSAVGCASQQQNDVVLTSNRSDRVYPIDLYNNLVAGVHAYDSSRTAAIDGQSPLAANIYILNSEQKEAINHVRRNRMERSKDGM